MVEVTDDRVEASVIGGQLLQLQMRVRDVALIQPLLESLQLPVLLGDDVAVVDVGLLHHVPHPVHLRKLLLQPLLKFGQFLFQLTVFCVVIVQLFVRRTDAAPRFTKLQTFLEIRFNLFFTKYHILYMYCTPKILPLSLTMIQYLENV